MDGWGWCALESSKVTLLVHFLFSLKYFQIQKISFYGIILLLAGLAVIAPNNISDFIFVTEPNHFEIASSYNHPTISTEDFAPSPNQEQGVTFPSVETLTSPEDLAIT